MHQPPHHSSVISQNSTPQYTCDDPPGPHLQSSLCSLRSGQVKNTVKNSTGNTSTQSANHSFSAAHSLAVSTTTELKAHNNISIVPETSNVSHHSQDAFFSQPTFQSFKSKISQVISVDNHESQPPHNSLTQHVSTIPQSTPTHTRLGSVNNTPNDPVHMNQYSIPTMQASTCTPISSRNATQPFSTSQSMESSSLSPPGLGADVSSPQPIFSTLTPSNDFLAASPHDNSSLLLSCSSNSLKLSLSPSQPSPNLLSNKLTTSCQRHITQVSKDFNDLKSCADDLGSSFTSTSNETGELCSISLPEVKEDSFNHPKSIKNVQKAGYGRGEDGSVKNNSKDLKCLNGEPSEKIKSATNGVGASPRQSATPVAHEERGSGASSTNEGEQHSAQQPARRDDEKEPEKPNTSGSGQPEDREEDSTSHETSTSSNSSQE